MVSVDGAAVVAALERVLQRTEEAQHELDRLDAIAGDGDHGVTMVLGWRAVTTTVSSLRDEPPGTILCAAAPAFADVGGSAGPLWGTALLRAGRLLGTMPSADLEQLAAAAAAAVDGMRERGRCAEGDRTVVDAMGPAAAALDHAQRTGMALESALAAAAAAAETGAARTAQLEPRHGRAALAPERAQHHIDAGAAAAAVFWAAVAERAEPSSAT